MSNPVVRLGAMQADGSVVDVLDVANGKFLKRVDASGGIVGVDDPAAGAVTSVTGTPPIASSGGTTPAISLNDGGVTLAKMADLAQDKIIGRATASTGVPEAIACTAAGRAILDDADATAQRTTLGLGALAVLGTVGAAQIDAGAVLVTKIENFSQYQVLGRVAAGSGAPAALSAANLNAVVGQADLDLDTHFFDGGEYRVAGTKVVGAQGAAVADAAGGVVIDLEARTALNALLARLRAHGMIAP